MKALGSGRFLAFELDNNQYAIEVERVEVVLETMPITRVPQAPQHLKGVINYRGAVIPVADLRTRFAFEDQRAVVEKEPFAGLPAIRSEERALALVPGKETAGDSALSSGASIVVLHVKYSGDDIVMGILADSVREVVDIDASHIEKAPGLGGRGRGNLVSGIGEKDGRFIVIIDIDEAFNGLDAFTGAPAAGGGSAGAEAQ